MKFESYNKEIRNATGQLMDAFDNIKVRRLVKIDGSADKTLTLNVPCVYGPRNRIIKSLENRDKTLKLPITSISLVGFARDSGRAHSVNNVMELQPGNSTEINMMHNVATPIIITYELSAVAKYMSDLEQILSNFVAIMNPDIYVVSELPQQNGNLKSQVVWDGNIAIENAEDIAKDAPWRVAASTTFAVKSWIFPGREPYDTSLDSRINKINFCNNYDPDYYPDVDGDGNPDSTGVSLPEVFSHWYDNKTYGASMDEFYDKIKSGLVTSPNYDHLPILDELSGTYWLENIFAILSGDIYDFAVSADLVTLIENEFSDDLLVTTIRNDTASQGEIDRGYILTPETLQISGNWGSIWRRMLSGDLSQCLSGQTVEDTYKYLIKEDSYLYLLYEDSTIIPLIT